MICKQNADEICTNLQEIQEGLKNHTISISEASKKLDDLVTQMRRVELEEKD